MRKKAKKVDKKVRKEYNRHIQRFPERRGAQIHNRSAKPITTMKGRQNNEKDEQKGLHHR